MRGMATGSSDPVFQESEFECAVCMECYTEPMMIFPCNHSFCKECVSTLQANNNKAKCPKCRAEIKHCYPDQIMTARLSTCHIQCSECNMKVLALFMKQHHMVCPGKANNTQVGSNELSVPSVSSVHSFGCPYCGLQNLTALQLVDHCNAVHSNSRDQVVCPICASMPWGDPNQKSASFIHHLNNRHRFEYDDYIDFGQNDDDMLQAALQASLYQQ